MTRLTLQLQVFRSVLLHKGGTLVDNYRPVQPLNGRTVYRSFWEDDDDDDSDDDW